MIRVVQPGAGPSRVLVWVFHQTAGSAKRPTFIDDRIRAACGPNATILNYTAPVPAGKATTGGAYREVGSVASNGFRLPALSEVEATFAAKLGCSFSKSVLGGFSEGNQGIRAQLLHSEKPDGIAGADGIHGGYPKPHEAFEVKPWRDHFAAAQARHAVACVSHSMIDTTGGAAPFMPVRRMLELITGRTLPVPESRTEPVATVDGDLLIYSYAGGDVEAHSRQVQVTLPVMLHEVLCRLGVLDFGGPEEKALNAAIASTSSSSSSSTSTTPAGTSSSSSSSGPPGAPPWGGASGTSSSSSSSGPTVPTGGIVPAKPTASTAPALPGGALAPAAAAVASPVPVRTLFVLAAGGALLWWASQQEQTKPRRRKALRA